jgi:hypothetical protein
MSTDQYFNEDTIKSDVIITNNKYDKFIQSTFFNNFNKFMNILGLHYLLIEQIIMTYLPLFYYLLIPILCMLPSLTLTSFTASVSSLENSSNNNILFNKNKMEVYNNIDNLLSHGYDKYRYVSKDFRIRHGLFEGDDQNFIASSNITFPLPDSVKYSDILSGRHLKIPNTQKAKFNVLPKFPRQLVSRARGSSRTSNTGGHLKNVLSNLWSRGSISTTTTKMELSGRLLSNLHSKTIPKKRKKN